MNVDTADPDLPSFASGFGIPATPPSHSADDDDTSRLFWVPARLHPELAPKEFKTFVEDRVEKIRKRSGSDSSLSPDGLERQGSGGGLHRKKSMLSRQIDGPKGYQDGAERLERKKSQVRRPESPTVANLAELEKLVDDPSKLIERVSLENVRKSEDSAVEVPVSEDMPILPMAAGLGLKRSTRTTYRRGSMRKGERVPFSKRALGRRVEQDTEESATASATTGPGDAPPMMGITRVQTEPMPSAPETPGNFSRPSRNKRPGLTYSQSTENFHARQSPEPESPTRESTSPESTRQQFHSRIASNGRTTARLPGENPPIPHIIETPPSDAPSAGQHAFPARSSSHAPPPTMYNAQPSHQHQPQHQHHHQQHPHRPSVSSRPGKRHPHPDQANLPSTLDDISSHPSPLPGSGATRTDDLTMVPTFEHSKSDKKDGSRKTSWGWLLGDGEKEKEKEKEKHREKEEREKISSRKAKAPTLTASSKLTQDKTRLDLLQTSIDGSSVRGRESRESVVLDRDSIRLEEERKKESTRAKGSETGKKEKDGILSAIFGGGKRTKAGADDHSSKKRPINRGLSPEPPPRILKPDVDYNWTRFSILEERAIYRMAHIKLANPKRALYSQVLLSNFMYSYLAKVQMMHPQMQIPAATKAAQERMRQGQQKKQEAPKQSEEFSQYQKWQEQQARQDAGSGAEQQGQDPSRQSIDDMGARPDMRTMQQSQPSQKRQNGAQQRSNGYNVGSGHDYLGYSKNEQPFEQQGLWDEEANQRDDDMW
ncbi:hypothetical protein M8818_001206 [Zalaria obscura]|uniref:Uncharacterized protein n=1 Tax=Zalaria obscura TaxID=2024903 RepID=A0ACC3SL64_9PEZI